LVFKNSNATSYCGCGESFALIDETEDSDGGAAAASDLSTDATRSS